jgi:LacI family transcriptional regulator
VSVTIYDIAERAGVSIATVSRAFSGHSRVAAPTRKRVLAAASELGYEPNASARSLARQTTQVIGVVVPMLTSYFFMEVIRGIQDRLSEAGYDLLVYASRTPGHVDGQFERALQPGRADGVLLCSTPLTPERTARLRASGHPVVLVDSRHPDFDSVSVDNVEGGYAAARHLLSEGRRRFALLLPHPDSVPGSERCQGFKRALCEADIALDPSLVVVSEETAYHGYTREGGYDAMRKVLAREGRTPLPDAVFATSDVQALGALRALREAGLRCPEDIALVGFDDIRTSAYVGLTTLSQPMVEMGRTGAEKLLQRIAHPERPVSHTSFSARLVVRETSALPALAEPARQESPAPATP